MSLATLPQKLARRFDTTREELAAALAALPIQVWIYDDAAAAAVQEAAKKIGGPFANSARFAPLEASPNAPATTLQTQYGALLFAPGPTGRGWSVCFSRSTRTDMAGFPLMLVHGENGEAGKLALFLSLADAANVALIHAADGTAAAAGAKDGMFWSPILPYGYLVGSYEPTLAKPSPLPHVPQPKGKAGLKSNPQPVILDQKTQADYDIVRV